MKIKFHYTYFLIAISFILCGYFTNLIIFTSIIIVHEFGHLLMAIICQLSVKKLTIYPYGGLLELDIKINTRIERELLVALGGIISQSFFYGIIIFLYNKGIIREYIFSLFTLYYKNILIFNILPIHPLDGSKIMRLLMDYFLPYKIVNILNIIISLLVGILIVSLNVYKLNYTVIMIGGIIVNSVVEYYHNLDYYYNKFLLERYLYKYNFKKKKIINDVNRMYRDKYHYLYDDGEYLSEKQILYRKFGKNK